MPISQTTPAVTRETIKSLVEGGLRVTVFRRSDRANLYMEVERKDRDVCRAVEREQAKVHSGTMTRTRPSPSATRCSRRCAPKAGKEGKPGTYR
jgi:hypothetical protein